MLKVFMEDTVSVLVLITALWFGIFRQSQSAVCLCLSCFVVMSTNAEAGAGKATAGD